MVKKTIVCDICNKKMKYSVSKLEITHYKHMLMRHKYVDICEDCRGRIFDTISELQRNKEYNTEK